MLMEPSFDATDAIGSVSEHSIHSDTVHLTRDQVTKLTTSLNQMQIDTEHQQSIVKPILSEIEDVLSTPPTTPAKTSADEKPNKLERIDENANYKNEIEVKQPEVVKNHVVLTQPPKKQKHFNPSVKIIQSQSKVLIVHVENSNTIFVISSELAKNWMHLIKSMEEHAKIAQCLKNPPEAGHIVLAKSRIGDTFQRGLIKKVRTKDQVAKVEFMEYGFTDIVHFNDMKCLSEDLVNTPRLVNMITIKGVPDGEDNETIKFLTTLQENQTELIVKQLELIEKTAVCAHFSAALVDADKFIMISEQIKQLFTVEPSPPPPNNIEMEEILDPSVNKRNVSIFDTKECPIH